MGDMMKNASLIEDRWELFSDRSRKDFNEIFSKFETDKPKYTDFYERHFGQLEPSLLLEIGVLLGGSMRGWKEFFPKARIVGLDINPDIKGVFPDLEVFIGDQVDKAFLDSVLYEIGIPDIIIDDGGHMRSQQMGSFLYLLPKLRSGGIYVIEDLETSFLEAYNDRPKTAMDMLRDLVMPTDYDGNPVGRKVGDIFNYRYASIVFEPNVCLVRKA